MFKRTSLSPEQALQKLRHYCGYQERCHQDVKDKLYSLGLRQKDVEAGIATLIEENYLNEERFAITFARGHFSSKHWGRIKIRYELRQKRVSDYCIKKALAAIEEEEYEQGLNRLANRKWDLTDPEGDLFSRRHKLRDYLLQKGYEPDNIARAISLIEVGAK